MEEQQKPVIVALTQEQLEEIVSRSADIGARAALEKVDTERRAQTKRIADRRLHNTELLLRNYRMFQLSVDEARFTVRQMEAEQKASEILNLMMDRSQNDDLIIESIQKSKAKTLVILNHINHMLEMYEIYCSRTGNDDDMRRYNILIDRFIGTDDIPPLSVREIAEKYYMSKESVYGQLKIAKERIGALIFGIDGMNFE